LQEESATRLAEKKSMDAAYRCVREKKKEFLTVPANVDRLLPREQKNPNRQRKKVRGSGPPLRLVALQKRSGGTRSPPLVGAVGVWGISP